MFAHSKYHKWVHKGNPDSTTLLFEQKISMAIAPTCLSVFSTHQRFFCNAKRDLREPYVVARLARFRKPVDRKWINYEKSMFVVFYLLISGNPNHEGM